jgi:hypothetical protein
MASDKRLLAIMQATVEERFPQGLKPIIFSAFMSELKLRPPKEVGHEKALIARIKTYNNPYPPPDI